MKRTILFLTLALMLCAALVVGVNATDSTEYTLDSANSIFDFIGYSANVDENGTAHITAGYIVNADAEQMFKDMFGEGSNFKYGVFGAFVKRDENDGTLLSPLTVDKTTGSVVANYENNIPVKFCDFNTSFLDKTGTNVDRGHINAILKNIIPDEKDYREVEVCLGIYVADVTDVTDGTSVKYITSGGISDTPEVIRFADFAGFKAIENVNINSGDSIALADLFEIIKDDATFDNLTIKATLNGEPKDISLIGNKLTFIDAGEWEITIYDKDLYCAPVSAKVTVKVDKLKVKFPNTDKYLYRVGNGNDISIGSLFGAIGDFTISDLKIELTGSDNVTSTYTEKDDWTQGTIKFEGTGVVTVTASCKGGKDAVLKLEVVDAVNATASEQITSSIADSDVVLLNDVSRGFTLKNGHTLYGNGFKALCYGDGSYSSASVSYAYITVEDGATLDNIQVYCDIFPESYMYTVEMKAGSDGRYPYGYSAVIVRSGTVSNSYIYGARNNILVNDGNATIENTVLECGSLANIQIKGSNANTVILNNVTTIQYQTTSKYDTSKKVLGFGVIVGDNESESNPTIKLLGDLKQYNWVTSDDTSVSNTYAQTAIKEALKVSDYQHTINGKTAVNIGIAFLNGKKVTIDDQRENKKSVPYALNDISMLTYTGQVYSIANSGINGQERCDATADGVLPYQPTKNGIVRPSIQYADANDAIEVKFDYDKFIYSIRIDLDKISGGSYTLSFNNISIIKGGQGLKFSIKDESGNAIDSSASITFNQLATNTYTLEITDNQFYNKDGELTSEVAVYSYPLVISATKTSIDPPKFTNAGTATAIRLVTSEGGDWRPAYTVLTGVTVTYWSASESKVKDIDLSTLYNSGTISGNV